MKKWEVARRMENAEGFLRFAQRARQVAEEQPTLEVKMRAIADMERMLEGALEEVRKVAELANTRTVTRAGVIPDGELIARFAVTEPYKGERLFEATVIPNGEPNTVANWEKLKFTAPNKPEAVKIAREYADRIIRKKLVYVYLANRNW